MKLKANNAVNTQRGSASLVVRKMGAKTARFAKINNINGTSVEEGLMTSAFFCSVGECTN